MRGGRHRVTERGKLVIPSDDVRGEHGSLPCRCRRAIAHVVMVVVAPRRCQPPCAAVRRLRAPADRTFSVETMGLEPDDPLLAKQVL